MILILDGVKVHLALGYTDLEGHRRAWASALRPGSTAGVSRSKMAFADGDPLASRTTGEEMTISLKVNGSRRSVPAEEVAPPFDCPPDLPVPSIAR
jgi:hypothetical protein